MANQLYYSDGTQWLPVADGGVSGDGSTTLNQLTDLFPAVGPHDARPAAGDALLYSCSDHGVIYRSDGTTWSTWFTGGELVPVGPVANFTASAVSGTAPLAVAFTDTSTGTPTSWAWDFGDGGTSTAQNPTHTYTTAGAFTVALTVTAASGTDTETKVDFISVAAAADWDPATMLGGDGLHPNLTGMTYLADTYQAALAAAGRTPAAGTPVIAYGDSWTAQNHYVTADQRAIVQLVNRLGLGTLSMRAVGGDMVEDVAARAIGVSPIAVNETGLVFVQVGVNDLLHTDTAEKRAALEKSLRAFFAVACAAERIEQTAATLSGGWSTNGISVDSGGSNVGTGTEGATATFTITTPGTYYLLSNTRGSEGTNSGGILTIKQGSTTLATLDLDKSHRNTLNLLRSGYGPGTVRIPGVAAGSLVVSYSNAGRTNTPQGYVDALVRISSTPPTILAAKPVVVTESSRVRPSLLDFIRDLYDTLGAEFGANVVVCDPDPSWTP